MNMTDLKTKYWIFCRNIWPLILIIALIVLFFWKVFILGKIAIPADFVVGTYYPWLDYKWGYAVGVPVKNPITTDVVSFSYPMRILAIRLMKSGQLPLWNPYILTGTPLLANFQSAPFTITNFLYFFLSETRAWSVQVILQHFLVVIFTYTLLRHWKLSKLSALLGGFIYAFAGFNLIWSEWNAHTLTAAFLPMMLLWLDKYLDTEKIKYGLFFALSLALQIYAGYPQVTLYSAIAVFLFWFLRIWKSQSRIRKTFVLTFCGVLGISLAAPQILPGAELLKLSQRSVELNPYDWVFLPFVKIITFIAPDYFGNHATGNYWGPQDYTSNVGFVGIIAIILAGVALTNVLNNKNVYFAATLSIVTLVLALPTPLSYWIWNGGFIGLKAAAAHRALVLWNFSISIMAAYGLDKLLRGQKFRITAGLFLPWFILSAYMLSTLYLFSVTRNNPTDILALGMNKYMVGIRNLIFPLFILFASSVILVMIARLKMFKKLGTVLLVCLSIFELFRFGWKYMPFSSKNMMYPSTPVLDFLVDQPQPVRVTGANVIPMNMRMVYGLESPEGYDAVYSQRIAQFLASMSSSDSRATTAGRYGFVDNPRSHLMNLLNTKFVLVTKSDLNHNQNPLGQIPEEYKNNRYKTVFEDKTVVVLENTNVLPRAYMVYDWQVISDDKITLDNLLKKDYRIEDKIVLEEDPGIKQQNKIASGSVKFITYKETASSLEVDTSQEGFLFVSDLDYPGWEAFIDEYKTKIYRADYAFRAILIPAGKHTVEFKYHPDSFFNGLKIGLGALTILVIILIGTKVVGRECYLNYTKQNKSEITR